MTLKTRKCAFIFAIAAVIGLYAAAAYRLEQARNAPRDQSSCMFTQCVPHTASMAAVR
ncbi:hypothetical protein [Pseudomonas sp. R5(2019)]|uniref:hypothetical protein n=1 Tax=Pseudomonas sp. R5(2019) TaxID=2697566 RepID=UPI00141371A6|nr:hypothetical protein [Pseudomonas sp. R5(2019)]